MMAKWEKLQARLLSKPKDFTFAELETLLTRLGYERLNMGKSSGSRVRFTHTLFPPIFLHQPHPSKVLKQYQLRLIIEALQQRGQL